MDKIDNAPIVFNLNGDGIVTTKPWDKNGVAFFDHDKDGFAERTHWITNKDGFLARDLNQNAKVDDGGELFSSQTLLQNEQQAVNGYQALAELDDNGDGQIDAQDRAYHTLKIWIDKDNDGHHRAEHDSNNELFDLDKLGIQSIAVTYQLIKQPDKNGNIILQTSTFKKQDGTVGTTAAIFFQTNKTDTIAVTSLPTTEAVSRLPDLAGLGRVHDLQQEMMYDKSGRLQELVEQFVAANDPAMRHELILLIVYAWTGVENMNKNALYPDISGDVRKIAALEVLSGRSFLNSLSTGQNSIQQQKMAATLFKAFDNLVHDYYGKLVAQTHFKELFDSVAPSVDQMTHKLIWNVDKTCGLLEDIYRNNDNYQVVINDFAYAVKANGRTGEGILQQLSKKAVDFSDAKFKEILANIAR